MMTMSVNRRNEKISGRRGRSSGDDDDGDDAENHDVKDEEMSDAPGVKTEEKDMPNANSDDSKGNRSHHERNNSDEVIIVRKINTGRWTSKEHNLFLEGLEKYGKEWKRVAANVGTRSVMQTRTHAQKYFDRLKPGGNKGGIWRTNEVTKANPSTTKNLSTESGKGNENRSDNDGVARNKDKGDDCSQDNTNESDADDEAVVPGKSTSRKKDQSKNESPRNDDNISKPYHSYNPHDPAASYRIGGGLVPHPGYYGSIGVSESFASASGGSGGAIAAGAIPPYPPLPPGYSYIGTPTPLPHHPSMGGGGRIPNPFYSPHNHHNAGGGNAPTPSASQQAAAGFPHPPTGFQPPVDPYSASYPDYYNTSLVTSTRASNTDVCTDLDIMVPLNHVTMKRVANQEYLDLLKINCPLFHSLPSIDQSWFVRNICHFLHTVCGRRWFIIHQQWGTPYPVLEPMTAVFTELRMDALKGVALQSYPFWVLGEIDIPSAHNGSPFVYRQGEGTWVSVPRNRLKQILQNEGPKNVLLLPSTIKKLDLESLGEGGVKSKAGGR